MVYLLCVQKIGGVIYMENLMTLNEEELQEIDGGLSVGGCLWSMAKGAASGALTGAGLGGPGGAVAGAVFGCCGGAVDYGVSQYLG